MSKTITIPKDRDPFVVIVNGVEYKYAAGETVTVPDSVADVIEKYENAKPKPDPNPAPGGSSVQSDWNQNDSSAADFIKNKPFYEETTVVNEPLNITWDGNTDGLVGPEGMPTYKVSDVVLTDEQIKNAIVSLSNGRGGLVGDDWDSMVASGMVTDDVVVLFGGSASFVRTAGVTFKGTTYPEVGIYFLSYKGIYVSSLTTTEPIEQVKTVITPISTKYLPEALQFGEENVVVNAPLRITWDRDTAGLVNVNNTFFKVSDLVLTDEEIKQTTVLVSNGVSAFVNDLWDELSANGFVLEDAVFVSLPGAGAPVVFIRKAGAFIDGQAYPEAGVYFSSYNIGVDFYTTSLTTTEPIEQVNTVVHPINKKYLPDGIGGNMFINITMDDNDEYVADKTYDEISKAIESGIIPYCIFYGHLFNLSSSGSLNDIQTYGTVQEHRFVNLSAKGTDNTTASEIVISDGANVRFAEYYLTVTEIT